MYVTVDVELDDFDEEDILDYVESLGYTVEKTIKPESNLIGDVFLTITGEDLFKIKNLSPLDSKDYLIDLVCSQLSLEYLRNSLCSC